MVDRYAELPAGYKRWNLGAEELALPASLVEELVRKERADHEASKGPSAPAAQQAASVLSPPAPATAWQASWGAEAPAGSHHVVHHFDALYSGRFLADRRHRSADDDVGKRLEALVNELRRRGPYRLHMLGQSTGDRLTELERTMPHFSQPLRLLQHSLALAQTAPRPVRIPPMLLLGPPGVGKTHFSQQVAEALGVPHAVVSFDNPSAGNTLRGSDKHWSNSSTGLLFEKLCLGEYANPVVLLDEIDKARVDASNAALSAQTQLLGALEPVTARRTVDASVEIEFDASLVTYIATANSLRGIEPAVLSRLEVFVIEPPEPRIAVETARHVAATALKRMGLDDRLQLDRKCHYLLAHLTPRLMQRTVEKAAATAVFEGREHIQESDLWAEMGPPGAFVDSHH